MASENLNARVFDGAGKEKGALSLNAGVFGGTIKVELLHGMVRWQRAKRRAGTHDVLTRSEIKGGAKKPYKQKGTGRARAGSSVSPVMVGGAVVHGPTPRSYEFRMSKKMRRGALRSALAAKAQANGIAVLEDLSSITGKTKDAAALLTTLGLAGTKVLVVVSNEESDIRIKFVRSVKNIQRVTVVPVGGVNVYDLLNANTVLCVGAALSELEQRVQTVVA
jgi:large subunit ribosomal protein L4